MAQKRKVAHLVLGIFVFVVLFAQKPSKLGPNGPQIGRDFTNHNEDAEWLREQEKEQKNLKEMEREELTVDELKANIARASNWKCPDPD